MSPDRTRSAYVRETVHVLFRRKWFILSVFVVVVVGVVLGALLTPRTYEASALLMLKRDRGELVLTPNQTAAGTFLPRVDLAQDLKSEVEMLKRRSLVQYVVQTLGPDAALNGTLGAQPIVAKAEGNGVPPAGNAPSALVKVADGPAPNGHATPNGHAVPNGTVVPADGPSGDMPAGVRAIRYVRNAFAVARPVFEAPAAFVNQFNAKTPLSDAERAVELLVTRVKVTPVDMSNVIRLSFEADDPKFAHRVLDLMVHRYLEQYVQMRTVTGAADFFENQRNRLHTELVNAEARLESMEASAGVSSLAPHRELYLRTALERETAFQTARSEIEELREKSRVLRDALERAPGQVPVAQEMRVNPMLDAMRVKMLDLESQRNKLLQLYQTSDRRVEDVEREIALMKERFLSEKTWEFAKQTFGENPARHPLMVELVNTEAQLIRNEVRARNLGRETQTFQARLERADRLAFDRARLERRIKMLEESYVLYGRKFEEARIAAAMDQSRIVNVSVAEPVQVQPQTTAGTGRMGTSQLGLLGILVGLVTGVGGAFMREYFDRTIATPEAARRHLGLPVLASIQER